MSELGHIALGQGARAVRRGRGHAAARRLRSHLRLRRRAADADPAQGPRADGALGLLVRADRHRSSRTTSSRSASRTCRVATTIPTCAAACMLVRRLEMLPVEFVVRGYLAGSGFAEYQAAGSISGVAAAPGPAPRRSPARAGRHARVQGDERARREHQRRRGPRALPGDAYDRAAAAALAVYGHAAEHARTRGIVLADTKFEFGLDPQGTVVLGDEVLTPDSSRFWPAASVVPGESPPSFDKQYVRDWLLAAAVGQELPGPRAAPRGRRRAPPRATARPTISSPGDRSRPISKSRESNARNRPRPAEAGHPRSAGRGHRAQPLGARAARRGRARRQGLRPRGGGDDPGEARRVATTAAEQVLANDLIESFEVVLP